MGMFSCLARVGEGLTYRLRYDVFRKILKMPLSWFDDPEHNPGTLAVHLSSEAKIVNALTSTIIGIQI
jgi:ATP-binding cassette subfamily B (MDR/TAP) protein 1